MSKKMKTGKNKATISFEGENKTFFRRTYDKIRTFPTKENISSFLGGFIHSSWKVKLLTLILTIVIGSGSYLLVKSKNASKVTYQTTKVTKGTLISSISATGTITSGNYTNVTTKVSGTVNKVYVTNGDRVKKGDTIATVTLDDYAKERQASAWVDYLTATENLKDAQVAKVNSDIQMWKDRQALLDAETAYNAMLAGAWNDTTKKEYTYNEKAIVTKTYEAAKLTFESSQTKYNDSPADIVNASTKVTKALRDYQENASTIVAPASGTISDLSLASGLVVNASSTTSQTNGSTIVSAQTVGKINDTTGSLIATVTLTEVDIVNVKPNQKVTLTLDAYSDKTFTGKVLAVNTSGSVSSGVTSYPVTILLDPVNGTEIYPNMAVTANIITKIIPDVITVPTTAIQNNNGTTTVEIMKNGTPSSVTVEIGDANDTDTVIKSGVDEGDEVVTSTITAGSTTTKSTTIGNSVFGGFGGSSSTNTRRNSSGGATVIMGGPGF